LKNVAAFASPESKKHRGFRPPWNQKSIGAKAPMQIKPVRTIVSIARQWPQRFQQLASTTSVRQVAAVVSVVSIEDDVLASLASLASLVSLASPESLESLLLEASELAWALLSDNSVGAT